ncbi:MAG: hypothetical protein ACOCW2_03115 [Chitinivibrionales bacterium]
MIRRSARILFPAALSVLLVIGCNDEDNPTKAADGTSQEEEQGREEEKVLDPMIGAWSYTLPAMPDQDLPHSITIDFSIKESEDYTLEVLESGEKTLFYQEGSWDTTLTSGSVTLTGQRCQILDTLPDPDTLTTVPEAICSQPIALERPQGQSWTIGASNLSSALDALALTPEQQGLISIFSFPFTKQE